MATLKWFIKFTTDARRRQWQQIRWRRRQRQKRRRRWCFLLNYCHCPFIAFSPCDFLLFMYLFNILGQLTHTHFLSRSLAELISYWWISSCRCVQIHGWANMFCISFSNIHLYFYIYLCCSLKKIATIFIPQHKHISFLSLGFPSKRKADLILTDMQFYVHGKSLVPMIFIGSHL